MARLTITKYLGNPRGTKKKKAARKKRRVFKRRIAPTAAKGGPKVVMRAIVGKPGAFKYVYWSGKKWTATRSLAKRYKGNDIPPGDVLRARKLLPGAEWLDLSAVPA